MLWSVNLRFIAGWLISRNFINLIDPEINPFQFMKWLINGNQFNSIRKWNQQSASKKLNRKFVHDWWNQSVIHQAIIDRSFGFRHSLILFCFGGYFISELQSSFSSSIHSSLPAFAARISNFGNSELSSKPQLNKLNE